MVSLVRPDILLLQEKDSKVIVERCQKIKKYVKKESRPTGNRFVNSLILYDDDKYEPISNQGFEEVIAQSLTSSIKEIVPNERESVKRQSLKTIVNNRISYVGLKMRHIPASPTMIFISLHNNNIPDEGCNARETARTFCKLVSEINRQSGCVVVAGADLNHQPSNHFQSELGTTLIPYKATERRSELRKIDYFIAVDYGLLVVPDDAAKEASVEALNFIDTEESDFLHSLMRNPIRPDSDRKKELNKDYFSKALPHDPLVCELKINMQAEVNLEDEPEDEAEDESEDEAEDDPVDEPEAFVPEP